MDDLFVPRATSRARWLAELSAALDEAQILLSRLVAERIDQADADLLSAQIEELRTELRVLHRRGFAAGQGVKTSRDPPAAPGASRLAASAELSRAR